MGLRKPFLIPLPRPTLPPRPLLPLLGVSEVVPRTSARLPAPCPRRGRNSSFFLLNTSTVESSSDTFSSSLDKGQNTDLLGFEGGA